MILIPCFFDYPISTIFFEQRIYQSSKMGTCLSNQIVIQIPTIKDDYPQNLARLIGQFREKNSLILQKCQETIDSSTIKIQRMQKSSNKTDESRALYKGQFDQKGNKNGVGELHKGQVMYFGEFQKDLFNGYGVLVKCSLRQREESKLEFVLQTNQEGVSHNQKTYIKEWEYYFGNFCKGRCHGSGIQVRKQFTFQGEFKNGQRLHGKFLSEKFQYIGQFFNNKFHGKGTLINRKTGSKYQGEFLNGKMNGKGKYIGQSDQIKQAKNIENKQKNTHPSILQKRDTYIGSFRDGKYNGYGVYIWKTGATYTGQYLEDKKHGFGRLTMGDQQYYGEWNNGIRKIKDIVTDDIQLQINQMGYRQQMPNYQFKQNNKEGQKRQVLKQKKEQNGLNTGQNRQGGWERKFNADTKQETYIDVSTKIRIPAD